MPDLDALQRQLMLDLITQQELDNIRRHDFQTWSHIMSSSPYSRPIWSKPIEARPMSEAEPYRMDDVYTAPTLFAIRSVTSNPPTPTKPQPMYGVFPQEVAHEWLPKPFPARFVRAWFWVVRSIVKISRPFRRTQ